MTYIVSGGALNSTHSVHDFLIAKCPFKFQQFAAYPKFCNK